MIFLAIIFHILFTNNYTTYFDENECETSNGGCQHQCENINGSYFCHCNDGFFLDGNGKSCSGKREIKQGRVSSCHKFYGGGCYFLAFMNKTFHWKFKKLAFASISSCPWHISIHCWEICCSIVIFLRFYVTDLLPYFFEIVILKLSRNSWHDL